MSDNVIKIKNHQPIFITICGARTKPFKWEFSLNNAKNLFITSEGNQFMFINAAIRQVNDNYKLIDFTNNFLLILDFGYEIEDKNKISMYLQNKATIVYVKNIQEIVDFINNSYNKIAHISIFSHGIIGATALTYEGDLWQDILEIGDFNVDIIYKINKDKFNEKSIITNYACRAGIDIDKEVFKDNEYAGQKESYSQFLANHLGITVKAFETRSNYGSFGVYIEENAENQKDYHPGVYGSGKHINHLLKEKYIEELKVKLAELQDKKSKDAEKIKIEIERKESIKQREENIKNGGGPIMAIGAWSYPVSGKTPKGLKNGLQEYKALK